MSNHAIKSCPRCNKPFECKPGNISQCQCFGLIIKPGLKDFLEQRYNDCLCSDCLQFLQQEQHLFKDKYFPTDLP